MDCHQSSCPLRSWCQSFAILTSINHVLLGSSFKPRRPSPGLLPATYLREYQGNGDIISPAHPGFALDPPPGRTCLEHLTFTCEHVCITLTLTLNNHLPSKSAKYTAMKPKNQTLKQEQRNKQKQQQTVWWFTLWQHPNSHQGHLNLQSLNTNTHSGCENPHEPRKLKWSWQIVKTAVCRTRNIQEGYTSAQSTSPRTRPEGIVERCPNHLSCSLWCEGVMALLWPPSKWLRFSTAL